MRYVFGCLAVSMAFIVGIWLLSLGESFQNISKDVPGAVQTGKGMLPKEKAPSMDDLLQKVTPLQPDQGNAPTGGDYFNEQFQKGTQNTGGSTSTVPQSP